jgi:hypothetical protein
VFKWVENGSVGASMTVGKIREQSKANYQTAAVKAKEGTQQVASEFANFVANFVANFAASFEKYGDFMALLQSNSTRMMFSLLSS